MQFTTSNNPLLTRAFKTGVSVEGRMTLDGTLTKTLVLFLALLTGATLTLSLDIPRLAVLLVAVAGGLMLVLATARDTAAARITAVPYAFLQGAALATVSAGLEASTHGVVGLAVGLTTAAALAILAAYRSRLIRPSARFRAGVVGATGAVVIVYIADFSARLVGFGSALGSGADSGFGVFVALAILGVALLNLVLDYDFIERAAAQGAPRSMEWFGAFSITVTLIWVYVQFLELLGGDD